MSNAGPRRPRWAEPVWVEAATYRFVNVGEAPAFDVVLTTARGAPHFPGMPDTSVPEMHVDVVPPGGHVDVDVVVRADRLPERPAWSDPRTMGWPPVAVIVCIAWNYKRNWSPSAADSDPLGLIDLYGFVRSNLAEITMPPNQIPRLQRPMRPPGMSQQLSESFERYEHFDRVRNVWINSTTAVLHVLDKWERNVEVGRRLFSNDDAVSAQAFAELSDDLDSAVLAVFVSFAMLQEQSWKILRLCDREARARIAGRRDQLQRSVRFARHVTTIRNYIAHHGLIGWEASHAYGSDTCSIEVAIDPILRWAQTRDRKRVDADNVLFADFLDQYGHLDHSKSVSLRTWMDEMRAGHEEVMSMISEHAWSSISRMLVASSDKGGWAP